MKNDSRKRGKFCIWLSVPDFILAFIMLSLASSEKDSWEYYLSSSHRSDVDMVSMLGILFLIAGVVELIYGFVLLSTADEVQSAGVESGIKGPVLQQANENPWVDGEIVKKEWNHDQHQIEWIVIKKKNGAPARFWHYTTDGVVYTVGDTGRAMVKDGQITEFISNKQEV